jgi:hypothetical protein
VTGWHLFAAPHRQAMFETTAPKEWLVGSRSRPLE